MDAKHKQMSIAAVCFAVGILLIGIGYGGYSLSVTGVPFGFTVVDSVSGKPVVGALVTVVGTFSGGGTVPFQSYTKADGVATVHVPMSFLPVISWGVSASGYVTQTGVGAPVNPLTVHLVSSSPGNVPQSPSNSTTTNSTTPSLAPSWQQSVLMGLGGFSMFLGIIVLVKKPH